MNSSLKLHISTNYTKSTNEIKKFLFAGDEVRGPAIAEVRRKKKLPGIERLHRFIEARTGRTGKHHETYLSDIRRTDPQMAVLVRLPRR